MTVNIDYEADKKLDFDYEKIIREVINGALDFEECPYETEVNVVLTTNDEIAMINRDYRDLFKPTDVLSFPMIDYVSPGDFSVLEDGLTEDFFNPESGELILGDIILSVIRLSSRLQVMAILSRENWDFWWLTVCCIYSATTICRMKNVK